MSKLEIKKYEVTMYANGKRWTCYTSARSAFHAMLQMSMKYKVAQGQATGAKVVGE